MKDYSMIAHHLNYDEKTGEFTWKVRPAFNSRRKIGDKAGTINHNGYLVIGLNGIYYMAHRIAWFLFYGDVKTGDIDHINGDKLDNRIENLRNISRIANQQNRHKCQSNNKTNYLGVSFHTIVGRYRAVIKIDGKHVHLGYFDDPKIAHEKYLEVKRQYHEGCTI